ncbi:hypothetical protein AB4259_17620 [Vibrio amylolyticus]|uniref:hypothetical protein n=1 Tax=Vibrio amylolyticus TaxID=2847292 RepID=UPI003551B890
MDIHTLYQRVQNNREKIDLSLNGVNQYDLLIAAHSSCGDNFTNTIGYCLQIRQGNGAVGSDNQVFLRHCDGSVSVHYQQAFYRVSNTDRTEVLRRFTVKPEDEKPNVELRCPNGIAASHFRVPLSEDCYS